MSSYVVITEETAPGGGTIKHINVVESQPVVGDLNKLVYNGIDMREYGLYVSGDKTFDSPKKDYNKVSIPGRSGDLYFWNGSYSNVTLKYSAILIEDINTTAEIIRSIFLEPNDYVRIEDSYHPDEYRMGIFIGPLEFNPIRLQAATTTLSFDCKPQRWLKSGEEEISVTANATSTIANATPYDAKPLIRLTGNSTPTITLGGVSFTVESSSDYYTYIDCDTQDCYKIQNSQKVSLNNKITIDDFPVIKSGGSSITVPSGITLKITPRWYIL